MWKWSQNLSKLRAENYNAFKKLMLYRNKGTVFFESENFKKFYEARKAMIMERIGELRGDLFAS